MKWNEIDQETRREIIIWYNRKIENLDNIDRELLAKLVTENKFSHFQCANCGHYCRVGRPDDWSHFQGVVQDETLGELCADCASVYQFLKEYAGE